MPSFRSLHQPQSPHTNSTYSINAYISKRSCSSQTSNSSNNKFKKPSSFYNLSFFSLAKAKQFFKSNSKSKASFKSPTNCKKKIIFSKSPSQLSTLTPTPNMEESISNIINNNNTNITNIINVNNCKIPKKKKSSNLFRKNFISSQLHNSGCSMNSSSRKNINVVKKKNCKTFRNPKLNNSKSCTDTISKKKNMFSRKDDNIISGDFIPEEIRKKMLIDRQSILNRILVSKSTNHDNSTINVNRSSSGILTNISTSMIFKNKYKELIQNYLSAS